MITATVDTRVFEASVQQLARTVGASVEDVTEFEAARVLEAAARATVVAKAERIRIRHNLARFTKRDVGRGLKLYDLDRHNYPDEIWREIERQREISLDAKLAARGLSRQSWVKTGAAAGIDVPAPKYVREAKPGDGREHPENFSASRSGKGGSFGIRFSNAQPTVDTPGAKGRAALGRAIRGRKKYFERNLKEGVFRDARAVAAKYRGLRVRKGGR